MCKNKQLKVSELKQEARILTVIVMGDGNSEGKLCGFNTFWMGNRIKGCKIM